MPYIKVVPYIDERMRKLCIVPYYGHPRGCSNYGKKEGCPPDAPFIFETLEMDRRIYAVYNVFSFWGHCERMRMRHPNWSERQVRNCLYWQGKARADLRHEVNRFFKRVKIKGRDSFRVVNCPEAQGVNVTKTMARVGIKLEWPPETVTYQVALIGGRKED